MQIWNGTVVLAAIMFYKTDFTFSCDAVKAEFSTNWFFFSTFACVEFFKDKLTLYLHVRNVWNNKSTLLESAHWTQTSVNNALNEVK